MPLYMDIHSCQGATVDDVARAHLSDMKIQDQYGVNYHKYWFNQERGKLFCLVEAPSAEAARCVHEQAHGLLAEKLIEVDPDLVDGFMGHSPVNELGAATIPKDRDRLDTAVRTVMFTDIVGSTEITSRHGDDAGMAVLAVHDRIVRAALMNNRGGEVKHTGDGIMAAFTSAAAAVRAACQIQGALRDHNEAGAEIPVVVRIGITAGEPVEQSDDLFGSTVQLAARLCAKADPGQILVSGVVAGLCIGKGLNFIDAGHHEVKGFDQPVETHIVEIVC